jgi:predicted DNA-binding transcriptional regulator YafY
MRADRLLSLLIMLQTRGRMTARALAAEFEVSVRTIYRDIEALSMAGIPVYAERGPGGGCALLDSYRTNLTGLTDDEVRALFMLSIPTPLADLGVSQELKAALLKLAAALPAHLREDERSVRQRIHLDPTGWSKNDEPVPHLATIHQAVWQDRQLHLTYRRPFPMRDQVERLVNPYGLVAKAGCWYLVAAYHGQVYPYRLSHVLGVRLLDDFDLVDFWRAWCATYEHNQPSYPVTVRIAPELLPWLPLHFGDHIRDQIAQADPPDADGWIVLPLRFERLETARERLLGFGRAVEVLDPLALRLSLIDFAEQIVAFYRDRA